MSAIGLGALLLFVWVLLWDTFQIANVLSGIIVVLLVMWFVPGTSFEVRRPVFRPIHALRFIARVLWDLVRANVVVAKEILTRDSGVHTGIVAVPLPDASPGLLTLVASVLSLSPGTMPIEVIDDPATIYIHVLHLRDVEAKRRDVQGLATLAVRAFGTDEAVASLNSNLRGRTTTSVTPGDEGDPS